MGPTSCHMMMPGIKLGLQVLLRLYLELMNLSSSRMERQRNTDSTDGFIFSINQLIKSTYDLFMHKTNSFSF